MLTNTPKDCELERMALKEASDKKEAVLKASEISMEKARVRAAILLAQNVEWESHIKEILQLESRVSTLESRVRSSAEILDNKIVAHDSRLHFLKRNWPIVVGIVATNAAITGLMIYFLKLGR